ncbi:MAG: c-type cytochrome [Flavobacteriales bacterium]|nr:c-type cytochrome [Flavobacteriales bacterium]
MKKLAKILGVLLLLVVLVVIGAITYVTKALPNIEVPADLKVDVTPERVARGEYLANSVCVCMDCHSTRDWNTYAAPLTPGTLGKGGERFDETMNFPGTFFARNITPFGIKEWSDGEIYRAITSGVSRDGHPFFPVMPYPNYNKLDNEDVYSIIAYLRSLPPIEATHPASEPAFPVSVILHTIPEPAAPAKRPDPTDVLAYGAYMTNAAACMECHTKTEKGKKIGEPFAGGFEFVFPGGSTVRSANITPHPTTGIGAWDKATFIARFKQHADSAYVPPPINWQEGDFQTVMPWMMYSGMSEQDLGAIFDYLRSLPPVDSRIEKWTPAVAQAQ